MNIDTADFKNIVKTVIREAIANKVVSLPVNETKPGYIGPSLKPIGKTKELTPKTLKPSLKPKDNKKVNEAGLTSEAGADTQLLMMTIKQVAQGIGDDAKIAAMTPEQAKQKLTVVRSILSSLIAKGGMMQEASYKVVAPHSYTDAAEDKARTIQTDPKVNEASYKVVAPRSATDAKEDKARRIQTEPEVNETAYKTQGPSLRTFDDSPQFPDALNDPKIAP
jgi:cellobiose-specific phosphotransferase system component IIB